MVFLRFPLVTKYWGANPKAENTKDYHSKKAQKEPDATAVGRPRIDNIHRQPRLYSWATVMSNILNMKNAKHTYSNDQYI